MFAAKELTANSVGFSQKCLEKEPGIFICKTKVAITDAFEVDGGSPVATIDVGDVLEIIEGEEEKQDEKRNLTRRQFRLRKDGVEGWVTLRGSSGTVFVEENNKFFTVKRDVALEARFLSGSPAVRQLAEGEKFEVLEGPKTETRLGSNRVHVRSLASGPECTGWLTVAGKNVIPWTPRYKVKVSTPLQDGLSSKASAVRELAIGEVVEALDAPMQDPGTKNVRIIIRAEKDSAEGYVDIRSTTGSILLESISPKK